MPPSTKVDPKEIEKAKKIHGEARHSKAHVKAAKRKHPFPFAYGIGRDNKEAIFVGLGGQKNAARAHFTKMFGGTIRCSGWLWKEPGDASTLHVCSKRKFVNKYTHGCHRFFADHKLGSQPWTHIAAHPDDFLSAEFKASLRPLERHEVEGLDYDFSPESEPNYALPQLDDAEDSDGGEDSDDKPTVASRAGDEASLDPILKDEIAGELLAYAKDRLALLAKNRGEIIVGAPSPDLFRKPLDHLRGADSGDFIKTMKELLEKATLEFLCDRLAVSNLDTARETLAEGLESKLHEYCVDIDIDVDIEVRNLRNLDGLLAQLDKKNLKVEDSIKMISSELQLKRTPHERHEYLRHLFDVPKSNPTTVYNDLAGHVQNVKQQMRALKKNVQKAALKRYGKDAEDSKLAPIDILSDIVSSIKSPDELRATFSGEEVARAAREFAVIGSRIQPLLFLDRTLPPVHASGGEDEEGDKPVAEGVDGGHIARLLQTMATIQVNSPKYDGEVVNYKGPM